MTESSIKNCGIDIEMKRERKRFFCFTISFYYDSATDDKERFDYVSL